MKRSGLPIDAVLPALCAALTKSTTVVLQAPPGAGKSTVVPLALLDEPWVRGKRLIMLEPRRLAARAVAQRMAHTLAQNVGDTVGYRMRLDTRVSRSTRIEVVTEGVLTRMLQSDPELPGTAAVIFDEFHERSLQTDLGLALLLDARAAVAPDLRILVMSATLDGDRVSAFLGSVPIVIAEGRLYPVQSRFIGQGLPLLANPEPVIAQLVQRALREETGDILVFLPGAGEIRRTAALLESSGIDSSVRILPLFGELVATEQDAALSPASPGTRKVVLATNIAETSLTIPGVRIVVDAGLVRRSVFDPATGMSRLETQRISRASAQQRQGRAGRTESGMCYRAWSEGAQQSLAAFTAPEIMDADLAPLVLELARWGVHEPGELRWLDPPPPAMVASAKDLLRDLDAFDSQERITAHGREMTESAVHPRLAHMLLRARNLGRVPLAAALTALLSERDLVRRNSPLRDTDIRTRIDLLRRQDSPADRAVVQRSWRMARDLAQRLGAELDSIALADDTDVGTLLAWAYPDRIGQRRAGSEPRYTLANGRGAFFGGADSLSRQEFIVAVDLDDRDRDARILLAAPLARAALMEHFADRLGRHEAIEWDSREEAVKARRTVRLGALVLEEQRLEGVPPEMLQTAMLVGVRALGVAALPWDRDARELQARMEFVRALQREDMQDWPAVADMDLGASLESWLVPWIGGMTRREHLTRVSLTEALSALLSWEQRQRLDELAPAQLQVPSGSRIRIDYLDESAPVVSVRLQELFGLTETPRIGGGRIPITFKLLSPAQRPVQVTRDLAGFWVGSYALVRKDLRGRYPKHYWPENPLEAQPQRGVRRKP